MIFLGLKVTLYAYVQEVRFSGGGLKSTRPMCIHLFSGGGPGVARCILRVTGVSRGMTGVSFFPTNKKKSGVSFRCCQVYLKVLRGGLATPRRFQVYLGLNYS